MRYLETVGLVCSNCDQGLPLWQELLLGALAVAIAFGVIYGISRLPILRSERRRSQRREKS
jgi:hypothetical protein